MNKDTNDFLACYNTNYLNNRIVFYIVSISRTIFLLGVIHLNHTIDRSIN